MLVEVQAFYTWIIQQTSRKNKNMEKGRSGITSNILEKLAVLINGW